MEHITQLVRSYMISESSSNELDEIISDIVSGKATLLHIVKSLGDFLTSDDENIRGKGVGLLSSVLGQCPQDILTKQSVHVLIVFYCDKLDDVDTVIPALKGLVPLANSINCTDEGAIKIMQSIFQKINMRAHVQSNRLVVFTIVDSLLARYRHALKNMGSEFLRGYLQIAEGEKDPRNLMLAFSIARIILIEFDISSCVDDFFDITFCYFPISFRPPSDDPYGITAEDLKTSLRACLCATPRFGPLAMPLFLEKLTAGSGVTKRDTMQTIAECLPVYGTTIARNHAKKLWSALKIEIFQPIDQETADCALETTQVLISLIYAKHDTSSEVDGIGSHIVEESLDYLREPEKSKAKPAVKVMAALIQTTPFMRHYTISKTVPCLIGLFRDADEITNRPATLTALETIIAAAKDVFVSDSYQEATEYTDEKTILNEYKDDLLGIFTIGLKTASTVPPSLKGLNTIVQIPSLLSDEELGFIVHSVNEILDSTDVSLDNRISILNVLSSVSHVAPKIIEDSTLPLLFGSLPDGGPSRDSVSDHIHYRQTLDNLVSLCTPPSLYETFIIRLSTKLEFIFSQKDVSDVEANAAYAHYVLLSISKSLSTKAQLGHVDIPKYMDRLLPRIYKLFIEGQEGVALAISNYPRVVQTSGKVIKQVIETVSLEQQTLFASSLFEAFLNGRVQALARLHVSIGTPSVPFEPFVNASQAKLVPLFTYPILAFRKEVKFPVDDESGLVSKLAVWSLTTNSGETEPLSVMHAIASISNKRVDGTLNFVLNQTSELYNQYINDVNKDIEQKRRLIKLWTWIIKGLMIRDDGLYKAYVDELFLLFTNSVLWRDAAKALGEIGKGGEDVLTKKNFAVLKVLSIQKYFNYVLPRIMEGINSNKADIQQQAPYLIALTSLIKPIPKTIYAHHMPKLLPLLLRGLELSDMDLRVDIIETLRATSEDTKQKDDAIIAIISEHAPSITLAMLKNSQAFGSPSSAKLRQVALKYLGVLPEIVRYDILHPYKAQVLRELAKCLDDPKRDVRKEAVDSRANWFSYSG